MRARLFVLAAVAFGVSRANAWGFFGEEPESDPFAGKKCLYEVLGVPKTATAKDIRRTFLQLSKKYHPDVSKDPDAAGRFKEINEAYEILYNAEKRKAYDEGGFAGLMRLNQGGGDDGFDVNDIFSNFFGFGGGRAREEPVRAEPLIYPIDVPLDALYHGRDVNVKLQVTRLCPNYEECEVKRPDCQGPELRVITRQHGPGMLLQQQIRDPTCVGRNKGWKENCAACPNGPTFVEHLDLDIIIEPGTPHGHRIVIEGRGQEKPGLRRGHIVFVVEQQPHQIYRREGRDLHRTLTITLRESLLGFEKQVDLFGESVEVVQGGVTPHNYVIKLEQKGMPDLERHGFGDMYISVRVTFPKKLTAEQIALLKQAL
ncbi:DNAJ protein, putative [Babesia caballi]|uniref:DNAJ protein, putative n=1 Tax=Babesia caballi TaxID=5871 RepID=A0AAV4LTE7_BABCB|nr:DNAJ protein, putative [Babesia caballi]